MSNLLRRLSQPSMATSLPGALARRFLRAFGRYRQLPVELEVMMDITDRPAYAYCAYHAAMLAKKLGIDALSLIEFGVAGGNGLLFLERFAARIERALNLRVEVYGFDTGEGLPHLGGPEDMPYWFRASQYRMDIDALRAKLTRAKLALGNVRETVDTFFNQYNPAPVGAIFNDLDLYTSTIESLRIFDHDVNRFLPRVFMYFDDVIGSEMQMYGESNGELLAISEFNKRHDAIHIGLNQNLLPLYNVQYRYQIYYAHLIRHPLYTSYVGGNEQEAMESYLRLKGAA